MLENDHLWWVSLWLNSGTQYSFYYFNFLTHLQTGHQAWSWMFHWCRLCRWLVSDWCRQFGQYDVLNRIYNLISAVQLEGAANFRRRWLWAQQKQNILHCCKFWEKSLMTLNEELNNIFLICILKPDFLQHLGRQSIMYFNDWIIRIHTLDQTHCSEISSFYVFCWLQVHMHLVPTFRESTSRHFNHTTFRWEISGSQAIALRVVDEMSNYKGVLGYLDIMLWYLIIDIMLQFWF